MTANYLSPMSRRRFESADNTSSPIDWLMGFLGKNNEQRITKAATTLNHFTERFSVPVEEITTTSTININARELYSPLLKWNSNVTNGDFWGDLDSNEEIIDTIVDNPSGNLNVLYKALSDVQVFSHSIQNNSLRFDRIQTEIIKAAQDFIARFFVLIVNEGLVWTAPHITTEGNGDISFEWWHNDKVLTIFIGPNGSIEYLSAWGPNIWEDMAEGKEPSNVELTKFWKWLQQ